MNEIENDMASTEKSNNNRKGGRNRTGVWKYYTEVNNRAKCEFCDYDCIKNAKRMAKHTISCKFAPKDASEICSQYFAEAALTFEGMSQDEEYHLARDAEPARKKAKILLDTRHLIVDLCHQFYHLGWVTGTGGSISIRHENDIYMTPSGVQKERMVWSDIFCLNSDGKVTVQPNGQNGMPLKLSACAPLFFHAYKLREAGAVLHSHGMSCVLACALSEKLGSPNEFRCTQLEMIKGLQQHGYNDELVIPIIENTPHEQDLADSLAEAIIKYPKTNAVLVRRHGIYVWGSSWEMAKTQSECLHYLFECAVKMYELGTDVSKPITSHANTACHHCFDKAKHLTDNNIKVVLLDIEGTTTPISFVKDTLFPYSIEHVESFLLQNKKNVDVQRLMLEIAKCSVNSMLISMGEPQIVIDEKNTEIFDENSQVFNEITANVRWNVMQDNKVPPIKELQGLIWDGAYKSGAIKGEVYEDVTNAFASWSSKYRIAIYSSGSRKAQHLLFSNSTSGDLTKYISAYFDVSSGIKQSAVSYKNIALTLGVGCNEILFVTDLLMEAQAANEAGCKVIISIRPGNARITEEHNFPTATSFDNILP